jgi:hypothetical protein
MTRPCFVSSPPLPKEKKTMKEMNLATRGEKKKKKRRRGNK